MSKEYLRPVKICKIIFFISIVALFSMCMFFRFQENETFHSYFKSSSQKNDEDFRKLAIRLAQSIKKAWIHSRGQKTILALDEAIEDMSELLHMLNISYKKETTRSTYETQLVCPEHYTDTLHGFPNYDTGYVTDECQHNTPLDKLVTFLFLVEKHQNTTSIVEQLVSGIHRHVSNTTQIKIGIMDSNYTIPPQHRSKVIFVKFPEGTSLGKAWNTLSKNIVTDFVFLGRDMVQYDDDIRLERLVREIESLNVTAIGVATKHAATGHWSIGCYQRALRNYTLVYEEGYDESLHECLFCDHIGGPFLVRYENLKTKGFNDTLEKTGLFEDFFINLKQEIAVCADSMAHVNMSEPTISDWISFGKSLELFKIKTLQGVVVEVGCNYSYPCDPWNSMSLHPCCGEELARVMAGTLDICNEIGAFCEMYDGNLVGVVKMYKVLPWELDGDVKYYYTNTSALKKQVERFRSRGLRLLPTKNLQRRCISKNYYDTRYFAVRTNHWRVDFNSYCELNSYNLLNTGKIRTLLPHHDRFLNGPRNPGRVVRNKYPGYTQHAEHYIYMDKPDMWGIFKEHKFRKCKIPGRMDCLDQYRYDGNLQFRDPIP